MVAKYQTTASSRPVHRSSNAKPQPDLANPIFVTACTNRKRHKAVSLIEQAWKLVRDAVPDVPLYRRTRPWAVRDGLEFRLGSDGGPRLLWWRFQ